MGMVTGKCPKCGATNNEKCNAWVYGSPVRTCKKCGAEYLDKRWRELAIEGEDSRTRSPKMYIIMSGVFLIAGILCFLWLRYLWVTKGFYPTKLLGCVIICAIGAVGCFAVFLRIVTGFEDKENAKYLEESRARLRDPEYVRKLEMYGYNVPEEFRK